MDAINLPTDVQRYCSRCGAELRYSDVVMRHEADGLHGQARFACTRCSMSGGMGWSTGRGTSTSKRIPLADLPDDRREHIERGLQVLRAFGKRGATAYLALIDFPVYLPAILPAHLTARSDSHWFYKDREGRQERPGLSQWSIAFAGPDEAPTDGLTIQLLDSERHGSNVLDNQSPQSVTWRLTGVAGQVLAELDREHAIHSVVNEQAVIDAQMSRLNIRFLSGEQTEWEVLHIAAPAPLCHAFARVAGTDINIAAAGGIASDLAPLLSSMERITLDSHQLARITEELRAASPARYTMH